MEKNTGGVRSAGISIDRTDCSRRSLMFSFVTNLIKTIDLFLLSIVRFVIGESD